MSRGSQIPPQCISGSVTRPAVSKSHDAHRDTLTILHSGRARKLRPAMPMQRAEAPRPQWTCRSPHATSGLTPGLVLFAQVQSRHSWRREAWMSLCLSVTK